MTIPLFQVDAFTEKPFAGNPAAVCLLDRPQPEAWMQAVANEMNLSETAFLAPRGEDYDLRWFTPTTEVDLCGHATIATAHTLWASGRRSRQETLHFHTRSGLLSAVCDGNWVVLDFPSNPAEPAAPPTGLLESLSVAPTFVGKSRFDYLLEVASESEVLATKPDFERLGQIPARGVIVTARSDGAPYDFVSRFFAPACGVDEDPVCGSAHCTLAPYWAAKLGKDAMLAHQISDRGGEIRVTLVGDRVKLAGRAVIVSEGNLVSE